MSKLLPVAALLLFAATANLSVYSQDKDKTEKPTTTTVDAWRTALPVNETPAGAAQNPNSAETNDAKTAETAAEIEKTVFELEKKLMEALKNRDAAALQKLLANDFLFAGINIGGAQSDKKRFINWVVKQFELKTFAVEKTALRVSASTAVVTYNYKRQASIGGTAADGDYVVTDVWVKRGGEWLLVAHHSSPMPKP